MARHAAQKNPTPTSGARRTLLRAGLTMAAAGAAVAAGGASASAADAAPGTLSPLAVTQGIDAAATHGLAPVANLQLDPLANTGVDPLDNGVGTQIADFKPLSTAAVTGPVTSGSSLSELPVVGAAAGLLPG
ncbi:hypothetical protein [Streptomyces sp. NPDC050145]|uniref:hypothetical protein n=1 Tax=Streptomyces sp. NPDC050145 TaxID=3365602 RepID=UPI0037A4CC78